MKFGVYMLPLINLIEFEIVAKDIFCGRKTLVAKDSD